MSAAPPGEPRQRSRALSRSRARTRARARARSSTWQRRWRDRGSASLWLLVVGLLLVAAGAFAAAVGAATVARHQARSAADLGALAGARWALWGPEDACPEAAAIVTANGGRLVSCVVDGADLIVGVEVSVSPLPGVSRAASATARAGPLRTGVAGARPTDALYELRDQRDINAPDKWALRTRGRSGQEGAPDKRALRDNEHPGDKLADPGGDHVTLTWV